MSCLERPRLRLALALGLGLATATCSDDSAPGRDGPARTDGLAHEARSEAPPACAEGDKRCLTLSKVQICQGGSWVDFADCTTKKDPTGKTGCTCSATMLAVCQSGGTVCP